ncbi:hypothetical protein RN22_06910 [Grimontia sp. AD028]|uniref:hypothetical protein n=1 Tax=Grimontia sp. AD028 TaxID=1581149 RepID=UPI00061B2161|nr:hypothetical protein [Grimontia sp. AD028]KKD61198.1 hypothetical protein RN22_06910 [Grimontia sp. AD028]
MTAPIKDEDIVALYKESATETPSKDLDNRILAYANSQSKKHIPWWTYAGAAATVAFIALLAPWKWVDDTLETPQSIESIIEPGIEPGIEPRNAPAFISPEALSDHEADAARSMELLPPKPEEQRFFRNSPAAAKSLPQMEMELEESIITEFAEVERLLDEGQKQQARELLEQMLTDDPKLINKLPERLKTLVEKEGK